MEILEIVGELHHWTGRMDIYSSFEDIETTLNTYWYIVIILYTLPGLYISLKAFRYVLDLKSRDRFELLLVILSIPLCMVFWPLLIFDYYD